LTREKVPVRVIKPFEEATLTEGVAVVFLDSSTNCKVTLAGKERGIITMD